jgi:hypothetical protein
MASGMLPSGGVVHADAHRTGRFRDECIDSCAGNLQQVGANAFEHVTALLRGLHCGQAYFRQRENALQNDGAPIENPNARTVQTGMPGSTYQTSGRHGIGNPGS